MLQVLEVSLKSAEVKRTPLAIPNKVQVNVNIDRVIMRDPVRVDLDFTYSVDYLPQAASIKLTGTALCTDTPQNVTLLLTEYRRNRKISPTIAANAMNMINANAGLNSVLIIRPFGLLPPFMPPPIFQKTERPTVMMPKGATAKTAKVPRPQLPPKARPSRKK